MINLEIAFINVMSKIDLASADRKEWLEELMYSDMDIVTEELDQHTTPQFVRLNAAITSVLDQNSILASLCGRRVQAWRAERRWVCSGEAEGEERRGCVWG